MGSPPRGAQFRSVRLAAPRVKPSVGEPRLAMTASTSGVISDGRAYPHQR